MMKFDRLPKQIQKTMLKRQYEQLGLKNTAAFEDNVATRKLGGGFNWEDTPEGYQTWDDALMRGEFELFYYFNPKKKPKMTRDQFMEFYRDEELESTLTVDDRIEIFSQILLGSSDFTPQLLNGILNDYGVDDVFVDGGETLKELEKTKRELEEARKELHVYADSSSDNLKSKHKSLSEELRESKESLQLVKDNWNDAVNKWRKERTYLEDTANALKAELEKTRQEVIEWRGLASAKTDQVNNLCDEIGELKNRIAQIREESAKYYMSMAGTSFYQVLGDKVTTVSIILDNAKIELNPADSKDYLKGYHLSTKEAFLKAKAKAEGIINNQTV